MIEAGLSVYSIFQNDRLMVRTRCKMADRKGHVIGSHITYSYPVFSDRWLELP